MSRIFISYATVDRDRVADLVEHLRQEGLTVWWADELLPGDDWEAELQNAIVDARAVLVVWTKDSVPSKEVRDEVNFAKREKKLVPVRIEDVELWYRHAGDQFVDLLDRPYPKNENWPLLLQGLVRRISGAADTIQPVSPHAAPRGQPQVSIPLDVVIPSALIGAGTIAFLAWLFSGSVELNFVFGIACALIGAGFFNAVANVFRDRRRGH